MSNLILVPLKVPANLLNWSKNNQTPFYMTFEIRRRVFMNLNMNNLSLKIRYESPWLNLPVDEKKSSRGPLIFSYLRYQIWNSFDDGFYFLDKEMIPLIEGKKKDRSLYKVSSFL